MEYHGKFGHTIGLIKQISIMIRIDICYIEFHPGTQTVAPTLPIFQGLKCCIKYLYSHPHNLYFIVIILMIDQMSSDLHGVGIKLKTTQPRIAYNAINMRIMLEVLTEDSQFQ